jgi:hypothetical protein
MEYSCDDCGRVDASLRRAQFLRGRNTTIEGLWCRRHRYAKAVLMSSMGLPFFLINFVLVLLFLFFFLVTRGVFHFTLQKASDFDKSARRGLILFLSNITGGNLLYADNSYVLDAVSKQLESAGLKDEARKAHRSAERYRRLFEDIPLEGEYD